MRLFKCLWCNHQFHDNPVIMATCPKCNMTPAVVASDLVSTANANDVGLPCLREQQYGRECCGD